MKKLIIIFSITIVIIGTTLFIWASYPRTTHPCCEPKRHNITQNGAILTSYDYVPKEVVNYVKDYIKNNGYNGDNISFKFELCEFYRGHNDVPRMYRVTEYYHNIYIGYIDVNEHSEIVEIVDLMTVDELSKIQVEPEFDMYHHNGHANGTLFIARDYLGLGDNTPLEYGKRILYSTVDSEDLLFCHMIKFKDNESIVYINAITGEVIDVV